VLVGTEVMEGMLSFHPTLMSGPLADFEIIEQFSYWLYYYSSFEDIFQPSFFFL